MARLASPNPSGEISVLDPGAGSGVLISAVIEQLIALDKPPRRINATVYEVATELIEPLSATLHALKTLAEAKHVDVSYSIRAEDFIAASNSMIAGCQRFDIVIMNPPYFKLTGDSWQARMFPEICFGQPNIYMLFMYIGARLLKEAGELISITPRSFASGSYFRKFREKLFTLVDPVQVHLFEARDEAFHDTGVLQENVIIKFTPQHQGRLLLSVSAGVEDLDHPDLHWVPRRTLLDKSTHAQTLRLPANTSQIRSLREMAQFDYTVASLGLKVSTGRVVAFRNENWIHHSPGQSTAPLLWMQHVKRGQVSWPLGSVVKPQHIDVSMQTRSVLLRNQNCVLVRRFSAKDDTHRLIACPLLKRQFNYDWIGLENHLNFIWSPDGELSESQVEQLSLYLNSELVENYFRAISGHTQIGSAELLSLPLPDGVALAFLHQQETA